MLYLIGFLAILGVLVYQYFTCNFAYWKKRNVLGPKPWIFFGSLPNNFLRNRSVAYDFQKIYKDFKERSPFVGIFEERQPALLLIEPELVRDVMTRYFKHFQNNSFDELFNKETDPLFASNTLILKGEEWKKKRAEISPGFTPSRMKALYPIMEDVTNKLKKYIVTQKNQNTKIPLNAYDLCSRFTIDVVSSAIFSVDAESFTNEDSEIRKIGKRLFEPSMKAILIAIMFTLIPPMKYLLKFKAVPQDVEDFLIRLLNDALKYREDHNVERDDFLGYLISLQKKKDLSDFDIMSHGINFFADGFDTTSGTLSHTLYELGSNPKVQEKLRKEITETLAEKGKISYETLSEMPYLDQVFNESLRMHPTFIFTSRKCNDPIEIEGVKGHKLLIEKGMHILIPIHAIHSHEDNYENVDQFCPERFDADKGGVKSCLDKGVWLPFGNGPRICLGMRFALAQSKAALVELVKNFEITVNEKTKRPLIIDPQAFLNIKKGGLWLDFKLIE